MREFTRNLPKPLLGAAAAVLLAGISGGLIFMQSGGGDEGGAEDLAVVAQGAACAPSDAPGSAFALAAEEPDTVLDDTGRITGWSRQLQDSVDGAIIACSMAIYASAEAAHEAYLDRVREIESNSFSTTLVAGEVRRVDAPGIGEESTVYEAEADSGSTRHTVFVVFRQGRATGSAQLRELKTGLDADALIAVGQAMAGRLSTDGAAAAGAPPAAVAEDAKAGDAAEDVSSTTGATKVCWQRGPQEVVSTNKYPASFTYLAGETSLSATDTGDPTGLIRPSRPPKLHAGLSWTDPPATLCVGDRVPLTLSGDGDLGLWDIAEFRQSYAGPAEDQLGANPQSLRAGIYILNPGTSLHRATGGFAASQDYVLDASDSQSDCLCAPFRISVRAVGGYGPTVFEVVLTWTYTPGGQPAEAKPPLIFIPGVTGSQLVGVDGHILWPPEGPGASRATTDLTQDFVRLSLNPATAPHEAITVTDVIRDDGPSVPVYGPLLSHLTSAGGYKEYAVNNNPARRTAAGCDMTQEKQQPTLFVFAYDWRRSNVDSAAALADYVDCVQRFYPGKKVDILAHSMGGLIARRYILDHPGTVDQLITVATPFLGSPKPLYQILNGTTGIGYSDAATSALYGTELRDMLEYYPGIHELMSTRSYFDLGGRPYAIQQRDDDVGKLVDTYEEFMGLSGIVDRILPRPSYNRKTPAQSNRDFHDYMRNGNAQDDWSHDSTGVRYFHIVGVQKAEATLLNVNQRHTFVALDVPETISYQVDIYGLGDGTVPQSGAQRVGEGKSLNAPGATIVVLGAETGDADGLLEHTGLVTNPRVQKQVLDWLSAKD